jgi:hypothetical protein
MVTSGTVLIAAASRPVFESLHRSLVNLTESIDGSEFSTEVQLYQQILLVNKTQHRGTIYIRKLIGVSRYLKKLRSIPVLDQGCACRDLIGIQLTSVLLPAIADYGGTGRQKPSNVIMPCLSAVHELLETIQRMEPVISTILKFLMESAREMRGMLAASNFMPFSLSMLAIVSRLHLLVTELGEDCSDCTNCWHPCLQFLPTEDTRQIHVLVEQIVKECDQTHTATPIETKHSVSAEAANGMGVQQEYTDHGDAGENDMKEADRTHGDRSEEEQSEHDEQQKQQAREERAEGDEKKIIAAHSKANARAEAEAEAEQCLWRETRATAAAARVALDSTSQMEAGALGVCPPPPDAGRLNSAESVRATVVRGRAKAGGEDVAQRGRWLWRWRLANAAGGVSSYIHLLTTASTYYSKFIHSLPATKYTLQVALVWGVWAGAGAFSAESGRQRTRLPRAV